MRTLSLRHYLLLGLFALATWNLCEAGYIHAKAWVAQMMIKSAWAETDSDKSKIKPWPWADTHPVAHIKLDRIYLDLIVLAGATGSSLAFGPGHLEGSPPPGAAGNIVISGHRDTHFRALKNVLLGDSIDLESANHDFKRYEVTDIQVVDKKYTEVAEDFGDDRLTLITCYPFDSPIYGGPLRYVVTAKLVSKDVPNIQI